MTVVVADYSLRLVLPLLGPSPSAQSALLPAPVPGSNGGDEDDPAEGKEKMRSAGRKRQEIEERDGDEFFIG